MMEADSRTYEAAQPRRRTWLGWLILPLIFFGLGIAAMAWLLPRWEAGARLIGLSTAEVQTPAPPPAFDLVPEEVTPGIAPANQPQQIVIDPEITRRIAILEQRLAGAQQEARAAVGNADRAEGLLVAFAARRALDRGVQLGYIEALLRERFGQSQPQAVGTVITAARQPVTLQELQEGLIQVGPSLTGAPPTEDWWGGFKAELGALITIRREGSPSPQPVERLNRASRRLEAGQVDVALAEILRLPGRDNAAAWVQAARRYIVARRALDAIETAALLEPRLGQAINVQPRRPTATPQAAPQPVQAPTPRTPA